MNRYEPGDRNIVKRTIRIRDTVFAMEYGDTSLCVLMCGAFTEDIGKGNDDGYKHNTFVSSINFSNQILFSKILPVISNGNV